MKTKALLIILITLLIGGALGFFVAGRLARHKIDHIRSLSQDHKQEQHHLLERLGAEGEQLEEMADVLEKYIPQKRRMIKKHHREMDSMRAEMFRELEPHLSNEQRRTLSRMNKRMQRRKLRAPRHQER